MSTHAARVGTQTEVMSPTRAEASSLGAKVIGYLTTTDHKVIGNMYLVTSMIFFMFGGVLALFIRAEHRVEHGGVLEIAGDADVGDRHEAESRVAQALLQTLGEDDANAIREPCLSFSSHFLLLREQ